MKTTVLLLLLAWGLFGAGTLAQDDPTPTPAEPVPCAECHLDFHAAWQGGVHAIAYDRASFQDAYQASGEDPACLNCHTTDYQPALGHYTPNIQCEACHGETPADHPPADFIVNTSADTCGDCHTATFEEWENSLHAFTEDMGAVGCATCHNPHGQDLRFDTVDQVCLNCHQNNEENTHPYAESYVHLTHNEVQFEEVEVTCASCHMYTQPIDELHNLPDHTMHVETRPCTDCHEEVAELGLSLRLVDVDAAIAEERDDLRVQVSQLEEDLAEAQHADDPAPNYVQLTQGLIIGLGLGITFLILRRGNNGNNATS